MVVDVGLHPVGPAWPSGTRSCGRIASTPAQGYSSIGFSSNRCVSGNREPAMLTGMTEEAWAITLAAFDAAQSSRGEPGHNDRKFWKHCTISLSTTSPGALCRRSSASGTASGSGSGGSVGLACSRRCFRCWRRPARPRIWFRCSIASWYGLMALRLEQKGAPARICTPLHFPRHSPRRQTPAVTDAAYHARPPPRKR